MKILAVTGSLRKKSYNSALRDAAVAHSSEEIQIVSGPSVGALPLFNPDLDDERNPLPAVKKWRDALTSADGVMIFSPEYAHDIPGSLKNALDWIVGSGELVDKPVAVVNASTTHMGGVNAHERLFYTMRLLSARLVADASMIFDSINAKVDEKGKITDPETEAALQKGITAFAAAIQKR